MLEPNNIKQILSFIKDKTVQTALAAMAIAIFSFMGGRVSAPNCDKSTICKDISRDRDNLSEQLAKSRKKCLKKKEEALTSLRLELNAICAENISEAASGSDFDPNIHCAICIARGECENND